jgi:hypothetical protein
MPQSFQVRRVGKREFKIMMEVNATIAIDWLQNSEHIFRLCRVGYGPEDPETGLRLLTAELVPDNGMLECT